MTLPVGPKLKVKVREQVQGTVSQLPLTVNDAVLGYINFFSGRGRRTLLAGFRRAGRYRPFVPRVLDGEGVSPEFTHPAQCGSGFLAYPRNQKSKQGNVAITELRSREY